MMTSQAHRFPLRGGSGSQAAWSGSTSVPDPASANPLLFLDIIGVIDELDLVMRGDDGA